MDTIKLLELIDTHFGAEDLKNLCFYMKIDYDNLPGESKKGRARELIQLCVREVRLDELVKQCGALRPNVDWTAFSVHHETVPTWQVHGYSGEWAIKSNFIRWRGIALGQADQVWFEGNAFLLVPAKGTDGIGSQNGKLNVTIGNYKATFLIYNRINRATVTADGGLHLDIEVITRRLSQPNGEPGDPRIREVLGDPTFKLDLYPVLGEARRLKGTHTHWKDNDVYQAAAEDYRQLLTFGE